MMPREVIVYEIWHDDNQDKVKLIARKKLILLFYYRDLKSIQLFNYYRDSDSHAEFEMVHNKVKEGNIIGVQGFPG